MATINLPYQLQDGQRAYAGKLMANLQAIVDKINSVQLPGLGSSDVEAALQQLKLLLDAQDTGAARVVSGLSYDAEACLLRLSLADGSGFDLDMSAFVNDYSGAAEAGDLSISVDAQRGISGVLKPGAVQPAHLSAAVEALLAARVPADQAGNAAQICFADGQSFQDKLDAGQLRGADGVSISTDAMYYLRYEPSDGHLYLGVAEDAAQPPLSIDANGHLLYQLD